MVGSSFHNLLGEKGRIGRDRIESALEDLGYRIDDSPLGFDAFLEKGNQRYHIM